MKTLLFLLLPCVAFAAHIDNHAKPQCGMASWYGEQHRGRLMANGQPFNPDRLTAASWFYPLGTRVIVSRFDNRSRSVVVTITDRGPAKDLVAQGRLIDLGHAAFRRLGHPDQGLIPVRVELMKPAKKTTVRDGLADNKKDAPTGRAQNTHG